MSSSSAEPSRLEDAPSGAWRVLSSVWLAVALAALHALLAWTATLSKSNTSDEIAHVLGGVTIWRTGDFRMNPEAGNLQQRLVSWPVALSDARLPAHEGPNWWGANYWFQGFEFLNSPLNDHDAILARARGATALVGACLVLAIWCVTKRTFGRPGAFLATCAAALSPTLLAHAGLATTDTCAALFFFLSVASLWSALERATPVRWVLAALGFAGLALAKFSFPIVVPVLGLLLVLRIVEPEPLELAFGAPRTLTTRLGKLGALAALCAGALVVVWLAIWAAYGFRYSTFADAVPGRDRFFEPWEPMLAAPGLVPAAVRFAREFQLLPEAFLYGLNYVVYHATERPSFLNGAFSHTGFTAFFPYAFVAKTELALLGLLALALGAFAKLGLGWSRVRPLVPWLLLIAVYWAFSLASTINIGHRHILPTYPALFVLLGALGNWLVSSRAKWLPLALLAGLAVESALAFPNYLAFFNRAAGGTTNGWKHLVDSSLDWGQDLPAVKAWLDARPKQDSQPSERVYFAYFGSASPTRYGIDVIRLPGWTDLDVWDKRTYPTPRAGTYLVSATLVQGICTAAPGPWQPQYEAAYRDARAKAERWLAAQSDPAARAACLREAPEQAWMQAVVGHDNLRFARLMNHVRTLEPVANLNGSILVFELTDDELRRALD
ncbi:MAG: glycosyltransferase family 39 protein [Planctomycetes bacterium]|nr:glycosyltransferase family 39 protein [Planctomycetota bacterium]